ncbi:DPY30 domain-containing protein 1-like [Ischnura elegans]|uniref:DPY30 domain-containing protein 1-like n=1 Tax=Ischnura elegans TaxID=197161 RepID=UPI001ED8AB4A|nr:DPY30 domain-containing protein 1-like [Ischnura elegans]
MAHEREYVERHLGEPLTSALTDICLKRPRDPILYLSQWLLHWQRNKDQMVVRRRELQELLDERQKVFEQMAMETQAEQEAEEYTEVDETVIDELTEVENEEDAVEPEASFHEGTQETPDNEDIKAHVPVDVPEIEPVIDKKLHKVSSPIFETNEDADEDKLQEIAPRKESASEKERNSLTNETN